MFPVLPALMLALLIVAILCLLYKIYIIRKSIDEICIQLAERLETDTNVGIDISSSDAKLKALAAELNRQLKLLRTKQLKYTRGDQELKEAVTNISHDLRTPLTAIYGYLNLLRQEALPEAAVQYIEIISNRADALKALSEELFRYSVILSADNCAKIEELSLNAVLEESIAAYYGAIIEAGIKPDIQITGKAVKRMLDRQAVARIFSNIISNALKYSKGDLAISLDEAGKVHFANQAANLDQVSVGHLFDRFYTVESGRSSTGLGLSIARTLTEQMGGKIEAGYFGQALHIYVYFPQQDP